MRLIDAVRRRAALRAILPQVRKEFRAFQAERRAQQVQQPSVPPPAPEVKAAPLSNQN
jgi:hypothetical protein